MKNDKAGDRHKSYEAQTTQQRAMPGIPLIARLDGKAFHTYCANMTKPFDPNMQLCMKETTKYLIEQSHAFVGYTQSDEISLMWFVEPNTNQEFPFLGKYQKLMSVLAGQASAKFALEAQKYFKKPQIPSFDCRVWQVPNKQEAISYFLWREDDATRNAVQMAASNYYSPKEKFKKNTSELIEMLHQKGIMFADYPNHFKRGIVMQRKNHTKLLTQEDVDLLPEKAKLTMKVGKEITRSNVVVHDIPVLRQIANLEAFLFSKEDPITKQPKD